MCAASTHQAGRRFLPSYFFLCLLLSLVGPLKAQRTTVLPGNGASSSELSPQGALRYQRGFYLIKPTEMARSGLANGNTINAIGFTLVRGQSDTTQGNFKVYLQNTTDVTSRYDTSWTEVQTTQTFYEASMLSPGDYEWQVIPNCGPVASAVVPFSNSNLSGCNQPYNLTVSNITSTSATLSWEASPTPSRTAFVMEYALVNSEVWTSLTTTGQSLVITGLTASSSYKWRVRAACGSNGASRFSSGNFETGYVPSCNAPTNLSAVVTSATSATLSWTGATGASSYEVQYRRQGTDNWSSASATSSTSILTQLASGTTYEWRLRSFCINTSGQLNFGAYISGASFVTQGTAVCYAPTQLITSQITSSSARFSWTASVGATGYKVRYRLKNTIGWANAISPMTLVSSAKAAIPDTTGPYDVPFSNGSSFTYTGNGLYVAWEYERPDGSLPSANISLATNAGTVIPDAKGADSTVNVSFVSSNDAQAVAQPSLLVVTSLRPETRLGSTALSDSVAIVSVYALGKTAPRYQAGSKVSAVVRNLGIEPKTLPVTLTVKNALSQAVQFTATQNLTVQPGSDALVAFDGWVPTNLGLDSLVVEVPQQAGENVVNNNRNFYLQQVTANSLGFDDGTPAIGGVSSGTGGGLLLTRLRMDGCGTVNGARIFLTSDAKDKALSAVVRNSSGTIVAQSALFTPDSSTVNAYQNFYFTTPAAFKDEIFYIGLAQPASTELFAPLGVQYEGVAKSDAYFIAASDGSNLADTPLLGRMMIQALLTPSGFQPFIAGNLALCANGSTELSVQAESVRYANAVVGFSSQNSTGAFSALQALGSPDVFPVAALNGQSWVSSSADRQREFLALAFPSPAAINYVDIFETANPGAVDTVFVKNPENGQYVMVYSATAGAAGSNARKNRISFPLTSFQVSELRLALNSGAVPGFNAIDAVAIGQTKTAVDFATYLWSPGGTTSATQTVSSAGVYRVTVTNANGCTASDSATVFTPAPATPLITYTRPLTFCASDSTVLRSSIKTGITWSTGATTDSIVVKNAGTYTVTYNDGTGCGTTSSEPVTVTVNALPQPVITGNTPFCSGGSITLDAGADYSSYLWSTGATSRTITVNRQGTYRVTVSNASGCSATASAVTMVGATLTPSITGSRNICPGATTTLDAGADFDDYLWSTGAVSRTITVATAGTYSVTVRNNNGCSGTTSASVSQLAAPVPAISGNLGICSGGATTLTATAGFNSYLWSNGATTSYISVSSAGNYTVTVTNANGCTGTATVNVQTLPAPQPVITGNTTFCGGTSATLDAGAGFSSYLWNTGATSRTITVTTQGTFSVTVTNSNGCTGSASVTTSQQSVIPANPGPITGPSTGLCNLAAAYSIGPVTGASRYEWKVPTGASIASGQGTTNIVVQYGSNFVSGNIEVAAANACGQSPSVNPTVLAVQKALAVPATISGQLTALCGITTRQYSIEPILNASGYQWVAPAGVTITSGQGTPNITVSFAPNFSSGNLCVNALNSCGAGTNRCMLLSRVPAQPGTITGPATVCARQTVTYSIGAVAGATSYTWTVPSQATIVSGQGTGTITVRYSNKGGNVTVRANNSCGASPVRSLAVSIGTCATTQTQINTKWIGDAPALEVQILPVPTTTSFTLITRAASSKPLQVLVSDVSGRVLLRKTGVPANTTLTLGNEFLPGTYLITVIQGELTEVRTIIKL